MSDDGKFILVGIKQLRSFFEQLGLLLRTIDDQMKKEDWKTINNTVTAYTSQSIQNPLQWFPDFLFRFYKSDRRKNLLLYASVLFDNDIWGDYKTSVVEPYITAGFFDYGKGKEVGNDFEYWMAGWYGYYGDFNRTETLSPGQDWSEEIRKENYKFESYGCFGLPLIEIKNSEDVTHKIVRPLLELITKQIMLNSKT